MKNPYAVPPFSYNPPKKPIKYVWWSWHPLYPQWSRSCWERDTIDQAYELIEKSYLDMYHNKLIKECDGQFIEVGDVPCERLDLWQTIAKNDMRRPTDAVPINGWESESNNS